MMLVQPVTGHNKNCEFRNLKADSYFIRHPASGKLFLASGIHCPASGSLASGIRLWIRMPVRPVAGSDVYFYKMLVYLANFRHPERQNERIHYKKWYKQNGYQVFGHLEYFFEGGGDATFVSKNLLFAGYGFRSQKEVFADFTYSSQILEFAQLENSNVDRGKDKTSAIQLQVYTEIQKMGDFRTILCQLNNDQFYHMDVCFCPLSSKLALWYPEAFTVDTRQRMAAEIELIPVTERDARNFVCNSVAVGRTLLMPADNGRPHDIEPQLIERGFDVVKLGMSEFLKSGGAVQCLVLKL
uniref:Amidinotransferase n=1 Tax=Romanomermis culicivorax TaxID=13658 RepID=A0A915JN28_ROMCU